MHILSYPAMRMNKSLQNMMDPTSKRCDLEFTSLKMFVSLPRVNYGLFYANGGGCISQSSLRTQKYTNYLKIKNET